MAATNPSDYPGPPWMPAIYQTTSHIVVWLDNQRASLYARDPDNGQWVFEILAEGPSALAEAQTQASAYGLPLFDANEAPGRRNGYRNLDVNPEQLTHLDAPAQPKAPVFYWRMAMWPAIGLSALASVWIAFGGRR